MLKLDIANEAFRAPEQQPNLLPQLDLLSILQLFRRHWPRFVSIILGTVVCAVIYLLMATPRYEASFSVLVDPDKKNVLAQQADTGSQKIVDPGVIDSEVEILKSYSVALAVMHKLDLSHDPKFMAEGKSFVSSVLDPVIKFFSPGPASTAADVEHAVVEKLTNNTKAKHVGVSYVIDVSYRGYDPESTFRITNAIAEAYASSELDARYDASRRTTKWLQLRLNELQQQVLDADFAVQHYKSDHGIVDTSRGLVNEQQLSDVNSQLVTAQAGTAEAKARLDQVQAVLKGDFTNATVSEALHSEVISRLRAQYLDLSTKQADLAQRFGINHQVVQKMRAQMAEIASAATQELRRIASANQSDYDIAAAREQSIRASLDGLISKTGESNQSQVELRNLESSAQAYRNMYDSFLQKFYQSTQEQSVPIISARIITPAVMPDSKAWPKTTIVIPAALAVGSVLGFIAIVLKEMFSAGFRTPHDIRKYAGIEPLGTLPALPRKETRRLAARRTKGDEGVLGFAWLVARQSVLVPFSRFTETIRNAKVSIDLSREPGLSPVIGIVSSVPKEGKSTVSSNLALLTAQMGHKVLLIDGDLHSPSLTATLAPNATVGLLEALADIDKLSSFVKRDAITSLEFLPVVRRERIINAVNVITSQAMIDLLEQAKKDYEYIFIDMPPMVPVVDVKAATFLFDGFIFVVEWDRTSRDVVRDALFEAEFVRQRIIGAIINKANPSALKRIESYKGAAYGSYYTDVPS